MIAGKPTFGVLDPSITYRDRRAAYAVILQNGTVATVRNSRSGYFLPGGGTDEGETSEQTVLREIHEELGGDARLLRCLGEAHQFFFAAVDNCYYRMQAVFFLAALDASAPAAPFGDETLCWLPTDEAQEKLFHASHIWAVETAIRGDNSGDEAV